MTICWICLRLKAIGRGGQTLREGRAATLRENTSTEPPNLFDFWYNIHCQNGNVTGLIASRREPPQSGRQDRPSVANLSPFNYDITRLFCGLQDDTLLTIWGVALLCIQSGRRKPKGVRGLARPSN